jgi:adenosylcobyric acid synthase
MAKAIMVQGTSSGVGKTILTTALCRIFASDGYRTAPFKAQNITAFTAYTNSGAEIAVAQMLQANAAGIEAEAVMNPIVFKPSTSGLKMQLIINGSQCDTAAIDKANPQKLLDTALAAYSSLAEKSDIIVIEGAGSPVELNLNNNDIANMGIAKGAVAPVLLMADIDRGGVFASIYGTLGLLGEEERALVKATVINRFRGDIAYFGDGKAILEKITGLPVAGIVPYIDITLPEEDGMCSIQGSMVLNNDYTEQFDLLEQTMRQALDLELIYRILDGGI